MHYYNSSLKTDFRFTYSKNKYNYLYKNETINKGETSWSGNTLLSGEVNNFFIIYVFVI